MYTIPEVCSALPRERFKVSYFLLFTEFGLCTQCEGLARQRVELRLQIKVRRTAHDLSCALVTLLQRKSDHSSRALVLGQRC